MTVRGLILRLKGYPLESYVLMRPYAKQPPEDVMHVWQPRRGVVLLDIDSDEATAERKP